MQLCLSASSSQENKIPKRRNVRLRTTFFVVFGGHLDKFNLGLGACSVQAGRENEPLKFFIFLIYDGHFQRENEPLKFYL